MKKIVILTHRLGFNYGGIMQAYALQNYLKDLEEGNSVSTTNIHPNNQLKAKLKYPLRIVMSRLKLDVSDLPPNFTDLISKDNERFISRYIQLTSTQKAADSDILIVGSDQVWRQAYIDVDKYLFSFIKDDSIPRISYAASFGRDDIDEYSPTMKNKAAKLAKKFKAISVREKSGVKIVKDEWDMDAIHHIDPTLLFDAAHYDKLIDEMSESHKRTHKGKIFAYVLDREGEKGEIIKKAQNLLNKEVFEILPPKPKSYRDYKQQPDRYNLPPVTEWLRGFRDADFIITDSFHGCVFSIIYRKPFIAIGNKSRGLARFTSLLEMFDLENRLVGNSSEVTEKLIHEKIDWHKIEDILHKEQRKSFNYLQESCRV